MTLYRIKPFEWVADEHGYYYLMSSPYYIYGVGVPSIRFYLKIEGSDDDSAEAHSYYLADMKERAEQLWTERLLAALEPVEEA